MANIRKNHYKASNRSDRRCVFLRKRAKSYFEVLGEKATHKKLTEVNGDAVEEEVSISGSIVDGDKALEVLVECFC